MVQHCVDADRVGAMLTKDSVNILAQNQYFDWLV